MKRLLGCCALAAALSLGACSGDSTAVSTRYHCDDLVVTKSDAERVYRVEAKVTATGEAAVKIDYSFGDGTDATGRSPGEVLTHEYDPDYTEPHGKTVVQAALWVTVGGKPLDNPVLSQRCTRFIEVVPAQS